MSTSGNSTLIHLNLKYQDGNLGSCRITRSTRLEKLMVAYCTRESVDIDSVVFLYKDHFLRKDNTPYQLGMKDGDSIVPFEAKSLRSMLSLDVVNGSCAQSSLEIKEQSDGKGINIDDYTLEDLKKVTTQRFEQSMLFLKASFEKSDRLTGTAQKDMEEVQTKAKSLE